MYISKFLIKSRRTIIVNLLNSMVYNNNVPRIYMQNTCPVQEHMTETAEKFLMFSCEMVRTLSPDLVTIKA